MFDRLAAATSAMLRPWADATDARLAFERAVEASFGSGTAFAFWKGRVALYAILRALGVGPGDEVVLPGYTCVMVPGPVLYVGAKPVYVDIDSRYYVTAVDAVAAALTERTRAIVVQHTYGYPAPIAEICALAVARGIPVIEDCCHTFGGRVNGRRLGTFGTAAFFSGQWNKPFSTGLGGLALVHEPRLADRVRAEQSQYPAPPPGTAFMLAAQLLMHELAVYPRTAALATRLFRRLTELGLVVGSSGKAEFESAMPQDYARQLAHVQARLGLLEVLRSDRNNTHRQAVVARYRASLPSLGFAVADPPATWETPLLRYPLRVANKAEVLASAARFGVEIGSWFECPLHPSETDHAVFGYVFGSCPVAERAATEVINLPTHRRVGPRDVERTLEFVARFCRPPASD